MRYGERLVSEQYTGQGDDPEKYLISCLLTDPNKAQLPEIIMFLHPEDFASEEYGLIYRCFVQTYSGMAIDTNVWLKKAFDAHPEKDMDKRIEWRAIADDIITINNSVNYARQVKKNYLWRVMHWAMDEYADFAV